jgi:flavin-dependent thymidylate synthase
MQKVRNNSVELIGYYGGDTTHTLAAWASTFEELDMEMPENIDERPDAILNYILESQTKMRTPEQLLTYLAEHGHETPFEFSSIHFQASEDYKSHIHLLKHRIAVGTNTESTRYKERTQDKFVVPSDMQVPIYGPFLRFLGLQDGVDISTALATYTELGIALYHQSVDTLTPVVGRTRAKEASAYFLTLNNQVYSNHIFNFRSFVHFQKLRNSKHAQKEIRDLAQLMLEKVRATGQFDSSLRAFGLI